MTATESPEGLRCVPRPAGCVLDHALTSSRGREAVGLPDRGRRQPSAKQSLDRALNLRASQPDSWPNRTSVRVRTSAIPVLLMVVSIET